MVMSSKRHVLMLYTVLERETFKNRLQTRENFRFKWPAANSAKLRPLDEIAPIFESNKLLTLK